MSISILLSVQLHDAEGNDLGHYWYEDAFIKFFSSIHKLYAILAISVLLLLIILPISLLVGYQFSCCQVCLTKTRIKGHVLEEFMYSFNKHDASGGTRDCRWFYSDKAAHISSPVFLNDWSILQPCSGVLVVVCTIHSCCGAIQR